MAKEKNLEQSTAVRPTAACQREAVEPVWYDGSIMTPTAVSARDAEQLAVSIVRHHVPNLAYRIFLFGSRANNSARAASDIDIGIEGPAPVPYATLTAIRDDLEDAPTLYTVDVVDFSRVPSKFRDTARKRIYLDRPGV